MTNKEALTLALTLAIQAPNDAKAAEVSLLADHIAASMTDDEIKACKIAAQAASDCL